MRSGPSFWTMTAWAAGAVGLLLLVGGFGSGVVFDAVVRSIEHSCPRCRLVETSPEGSVCARVAMVVMLVAPSLVVWVTLAIVRFVSGALPPWSRVLTAYGVALAVPLFLMGRWIWQMSSAIEDAAHGELTPMIDVRDVGPSGASIAFALVVAAVVAVALSRSRRKREVDPSK